MICVQQELVSNQEYLCQIISISNFNHPLLHRPFRSSISVILYINYQI